MLDIMLILAIGIAPPILSLWLLHRYQAKFRQQYVSSTMQPLYQPIAPSRKTLPPADLVMIEGFGYVIGKVSCQYNARSPYIRCAVNPDGPCDNCRHYS
ncbi:hypothetical protein H6F44_13675 [Pseudanabaena sp. FACHB-1277]|jgi:hypothetical protein|uniref:Uncharacterized protein n=1 Tax=Pseudanabaena cinerea FACHB-1277 TaxID=2949581 RepID=A0A926Z6Y8_9CYAN|nr:DUF6464 family protein [Pseudanabaena cinerea]MBD2151162.1 hypothetical protein [Pseudanabaena cinerea FACHB-1277]